MATNSKCSKCEKTNGHLAICPNAKEQGVVSDAGDGKWIQTFICLAPGHLKAGDAVPVYSRKQDATEVQTVAYVVKHGEAGPKSSFPTGTPWTQFVPVPTEKPERGERKSPTKVVQEQTGELLTVVMEMRKEIAELKKRK